MAGGGRGGVGWRGGGLGVEEARTKKTDEPSHLHWTCTVLISQGTNKPAGFNCVVDDQLPNAL